MIEIEYCNISNFSESDFQNLLLNCTSLEREEILRYRFLKDRLSHLLGRKIVKNKYAVHFEDFDIEANGKPFLKAGQKFNISHAGEIITVAFSDHENGVDIEKKTPLEFDKLMKFFHLEEIEYIKEKLGAEKQDAFYSVWTRKEAFLKAIGQGFTDGLNNENCLNSSIIYQDKIYSLNTTTFLNEYILSICEENNELINMDNVTYREVSRNELISFFQ